MEREGTETQQLLGTTLSEDDGLSVGKGCLWIPVRIVVFIVLFAILYPTYLLIGFGSAIVLRLCRGSSSTILRQHKNFSGLLEQTSLFLGGYTCEMRFSKPFSDQEKLTRLFKELLGESGSVNPELGIIEFMEEKPKFQEWPVSEEGDQYLENDIRSINSKHRNAGVNYQVWLEVFNNDDKPGAVHIIRGDLPATIWDGTSCFNFLKELVNRYYDGPRNDVFRPLTLTTDSEKVARLDGGTCGFLCFLARLPFTNFMNTWSECWALCTAHVGGFGSHFYPNGLPCRGKWGRTLNLNFDERASAEIYYMLRKQGFAPWAGFIHSAMEAYKAANHVYPWSIMQQASLQVQAYEPVIKDRNLVGDWLFGPVQYPQPTGSDGQFTREDAQRMYKELIDELNNCKGQVTRAFQAKAYGFFRDGIFCEALGSTNEYHCISDSIWFNNYGRRFVHQDAGFLSWNWDAPFGLGYNTICVNGRTCLCFASFRMSYSELRIIRDTVHKLLTDGREPITDEEFQKYMDISTEVVPTAAANQA